MDYQVELAAPATLNVWIRGLGLSGSRDSIWVGVDGNDVAAQVVSLSRGSYGWTTSGQISLSAGVHTINVWMREDGAIVDRLLLTPLSAAPTGDGPAESVRGGGGPPVNVAPVLATVGDRSATENELLSFTVSATDADVPIMGADLSQLPGTPSFSDNNDGTGTFSWTPAVGDAPGPYSASFTATDAVDSSLTSSETISIDVDAAPTGGGGGGSGAYQPDGSGQFVMEAEHFDSNVSQGIRDWVDDFTAGYVGDGAMQSVPNSFYKVTSNIGTNSPRMDYQVELAAPATLNVWIRGLGLSGSRNDVAAQVVSLSRGSYGWTTSGQISLSAGVHTINVWMREDGAIVDRIFLTPLSTVPTGDGPAESTRGGGSTLPLTEDFSDGDATGWTTVDDATQFPSNWNVAGQAYVQSALTNSSGKDVTETYHRGSYAYWTQSAGLSDYRLSVDVLPGIESGDDIGVMFRYTDSDHYYRFSLNVLNGFARLESNLNGTYLTLASDHRGYVPGELQQIVVEVEGALIQVFVNGDPLFAVSSTHHASGGIALFSRDVSTFDNVTLDANSSAPEIVISRPTAHNVLPGSPLDLDVSAIVRNAPASNGSVMFQYGSGGSPTLCNAAVEGPSGVFSAQCEGMPAGEYTIDAILLNSGAEIDRDTNTSVAIGGLGTGSHRYDAIGNSITRGIGDNYAFDTLNLNDQRTRSVSGWPALLGDILTTSSGAPNLVGNEGISGDRANETRDQRLFSIIERNPESDRALVTLGTNDSNNFNTTSTTDLTATLQDVIDTLHANGRDTVYLSLLPPAWGRNNSSEPYPDPLALTATRNQTIISYNSAIQGMLPQSGVLLGPDLFSCFLTDTVNRFSLFKDNLHPNALGYVFMAELWNQAITSGPVIPPVDPCPSPIYILESLDPYTHGHKQNLLEEGDEYYTDSAFTLTNVPAELQDGIWVMQANADNANADADFLSFDAGSAPVTVYIAYDPAGVPPTSPTHTFTPVTLSENLTVSDGSVGTMSVVSANSVIGNVTIGGNKSGLAPAPQQGYVVIVVN
jgi:lysophospholipase L1-like esterase